MPTARLRRALVFASVAALLAVALPGCPPSSGDSDAHGAPPGKAATSGEHVIAADDIQRLERATVNVVVPVTGFFRAARSANIQVDEAGTVVALGDPEGPEYEAPGELLAGTFVEKGAVLVVLRNLKLVAQFYVLARTYQSMVWGMDDDEIVNEIEAAYDSARSEYDRQQALAARNATTLDRVEAARQAFAVANATMEKARADLTALEREVEVMQQRVDALHVRAPFAGRVSRVAVEVGEYVNAAGTVVTLVDDRELDFAFSVAETYGPHLRAGESTVRAQLPGGQTIEAVVREVDPVVDSLTRGVRATARLPRRRLEEIGATIPVDAFARGTLTLSVAGVFAPSTAVQVRDGRSVLIVADDARGTLAVTPIDVGVVAGDRTQVLGTPAGTPVTVRPKSVMDDGDVFRISSESTGGSDNRASSRQ